MNVALLLYLRLTSPLIGSLVIEITMAHGN